VSWSIWRERNARIFQSKETSFHQVAFFISDEALWWAFAGGKALRKLMWEPPCTLFSVFSNSFS
jgi:hypothetical protein